MKSRLVVTSVMLILSLMLAAFPAFAQEGGDATIPAQPCEEPGELTMWVWDQVWADIIGTAIDQWVADYCSGAEVDLQVQPWGQYWDLMATNAAGGELPDVFTMSQTYVHFYMENDVLLNLQPYLDEYGVDSTVWGSGMVDPYRAENGDLYALPVNWDSIAIFYNKEMFDAAGLEYPTADWTWDDFAAAARALTDPENDVYGASVYAEYQAGYPNWIASAGVVPVIDSARTTCTLRDPASIEALNFLKGLYDEGVMPSVSIQGGASPDDAFAYFASGHLAMVAAGSWKLSQAVEEIPFDWDIVQLPKHPETGLSRSIVHSVGYVASARTENPDLAANLILFLASDEGQRYFAEGGNVAPANPSPELQQLWIDSFGDVGKNIQAYVDASKDSQGVTVFGEIWDAINTEIVVSIFDLGIPVEDAVEAACAVVDEYVVE
ncbi:MAG TPA: sugar ABC transporter substrate-binding protein [Aggregatilineaceae bacterium]|nr:sugar ABC transporter substrate-binding protein [Anaerolineae bacterium]HMM28401.1 sugar ABC transporter substrate-binding protein [Aggregatilineaceae bacterium]